MVGNLGNGKSLKRRWQMIQENGDVNHFCHAPGIEKSNHRHDDGKPQNENGAFLFPGSQIQPDHGKIAKDRENQ